MGQRVPFPVSIVSANGWPCLYTENGQTFIGQKGFFPPITLSHTTFYSWKQIPCINQWGLLLTSESLHAARMQASMWCVNAACWTAHKGLHLPLIPLPHLSVISTCSSSKFPLGRDHLLVTSLYNSSVGPKSRLLAEMLLQPPPKPRCKEPPTNPETKRKGWIRLNREWACNQQQCLGTGQLLLVLVTLLQQQKDLKQWQCHSSFFSIGNNPVAQVKLMPGMPGTGNSWLQEEHMCAKSHLHHSISFPSAIADMCFLMWLTGLVS